MDELNQRLSSLEGHLNRMADILLDLSLDVQRLTKVVEGIQEKAISIMEQVKNKEVI